MRSNDFSLFLRQINIVQNNPYRSSHIYCFVIINYQLSIRNGRKVAYNYDTLNRQTSERWLDSNTVDR
jgi:hypothetical protein